MTISTVVAVGFVVVFLGVVVWMVLRLTTSRPRARRGSGKYGSRSGGGSWWSGGGYSGGDSGGYSGGDGGGGGCGGGGGGGD